MLLAVAASVFVATQKGQYDVTTRMFIKTPRNVVFQYIDDYRNWQGWFHRQYDPEFTFPAYTGGRGGSFRFSSDLDQGTFTTLQSSAPDSIVQRTEINGFKGAWSWQLRDSAGGSKITLRNQGKMGFWPKVQATLQGGPAHVVRERQIETLTELGQAINRDINRYKIKIDGMVTKPGTHYLGFEITSTLENAPKNTRLLMARLTQFFGRNKIPMAGKPFVLYEYWDEKKGTAKFRVCGPVLGEAYVWEGSDMVSGKYESFRALRTTLTGDRSHLRKAWDATFAKMESAKLIPLDGPPYLEVYQSGKMQQKSPSLWVTEIYVPVLEAAAVPKPVPAPLRRATPRPVAEEPLEDISIP